MHFSRPKNQVRMNPNAIALSKSSRMAGTSKRFRGSDRLDQGDYSPPEDWYEPLEDSTDDFRIIVQSPELDTVTL